MTVSSKNKTNKKANNNMKKKETTTLHSVVICLTREFYKTPLNTISIVAVAAGTETTTLNSVNLKSTEIRIRL